MSSTLNHPGQEGVGLYRGQQPSVPDDLAPGQPPHPSEGYEGPPIQIPLQGYEKMVKLIDEVGVKLAMETRPDFVVGNASGQTDSDGNATIRIYQAAAGMEARIHRLTGNALVAATGVPYTPAVPYSNSAAYLTFHDVEDEGGVGFTSLMDFGPPVAGGPIFPFLLTDNSMQAMIVRGPKMIVMQVHVGPASTQVEVRYQISLSRAKGIA